MTDNDNYGVDEGSYTVYGKSGLMKEPHLSNYTKLIDGEITIEEYKNKELEEEKKE